MNDSNKQLTSWFLISFINAPFAIVFHELGHFITAISLGYENTTLRYNAVVRGSYPFSEETDFLRALISAGGIGFTTILMVGCLIYVVKRNKHPYVVSLGLIAPLRNIASFIASIVYLFIDPTHPRLQRNDEVKLAGFLDITPIIPLAFSMLILLISWSYFPRMLPSAQKWKVMVCIIVGALMGMIVWLKLIGHLLLP